MITIPQADIEAAADKYAGPSSGSIAFTDFPAFKAGVKFALDYLNNPKHKQGNVFVLVSNLGRDTKRLESGDINLWLSSERAHSLELLVIQQNNPVAQVVNAFLTKRCGDKFTDFEHLWNAFRKFFTEYRPEDHQTKQFKKVIKTDSFINEQLEQG